MRKLVRVSRPPSGLYLYLSRDAERELGEVLARVRLTSIKFDEPPFGMVINLVKDRDGPMTLLGGKGFARLAITNNRLNLLGADVPDFGPVDCTWEPTGNGIRVKVPAFDQLDPARPHPHVKSKKVRGPVLDQDNPYAQLGVAIRTINQICASGEVKDVLFSLPKNPDGSDVYTTHTFRITAERTIKEILS